jgi:exodeoxyribonuclease VII large subunit
MDMIFGKVYTVSEVNATIKGLIHSKPELANLQIQGEISNFRRYPSGHCYFNLKDGRGLLKCVMFAGSARRLKQLPQNGDKVVGIGRIDLYERDGVYQFYVDMMMPLGAGDLMAAFEALKKRLAAEGLFDPALKKPIPTHPRVVGVVTSSAGAAVRDIITVSGRRDPSVKILLYPVKVQGTEAPPEIVHGIEFLNRHHLCDVMIVGRGGGSMEDLWAFNDERVVRAIVASDIPVISAVGHEIDFTLSDFAADLRAATPSAAAELAVPDTAKERAAFEGLAQRLTRSVELELSRCRDQLSKMAQRPCFLYPQRLFENTGLRLDQLTQAMAVSGQKALQLRKDRYQVLAVKLQALDPQKVLERGYSITETDDGHVILDPGKLTKGDRIRTYMSGGTIESLVETAEVHKHGN